MADKPRVEEPAQRDKPSSEAGKTESLAAPASAANGTEKAQRDFPTDFYRFRAIPVAPEVRAQWLAATPPLVPAEALQDTVPPNNDSEALRGNSARNSPFDSAAHAIRRKKFARILTLSVCLGVVVALGIVQWRSAAAPEAAPPSPPRSTTPTPAARPTQEPAPAKTAEAPATPRQAPSAVSAPQVKPDAPTPKSSAPVAARLNGKPRAQPAAVSQPSVVQSTATPEQEPAGAPKRKPRLVFQPE